MTLMQLQYFLEIARTKNFTVAASNLYVSQSSLSYAIRELETELDVPLFMRRPNRGIELSMYGMALIPYAEEGLRLLEDGKNHISSMKSPLHGKVRLGFFHSIAFSAVPALLKLFREDNPANEIDFDTLVHHNWIDFRQMLLDGKCDLVLSAGNLGGNVESVKIAEHRMFLIVPGDHHLAGLEHVSLREICDEQFIQIDSGSNMDKNIKTMFEDSGLKPKMRYVADWTAQQLAVTSGKGIAITCDAAFDTRYVSRIDIDSDYTYLPLYLSWTNMHKLSGASMYVRDYLLKLAESDKHELIF